MDPTILAILGAPSGSTVAGFAVGTGLYFNIHKKILQFVRRLKQENPRSVRSRANREIVRSIRHYVRSNAEVRQLISQRNNVNTISRNNEDWREEMEEVIRLCSVNANVKFPEALPSWKQQSARKIAEGSFGEIYSFCHLDGSLRIFKCMPVDMQLLEERERILPMKFAVPEIVSSVSLSKLNDGYLYAAPNFPVVYRVCIVNDKFPRTLMNAWWEFHDRESTEYRRPDSFREDQKFLTIETSFCGSSLNKDVVENPCIGASIMTQIVSALAIAEEACNFEHRDLHLGNIMVQRTDAPVLKYILSDLCFAVKTYNRQVFIIDFTYSRIKDGTRIYSTRIDRSDEDLYPNENFWLNHDNIYEKMADILQNDFDEFRPKTNILWLKYISETILSYLEHSIAPHFGYEVEDYRRMYDLLRRWNSCLLEFNSSRAFLEVMMLRDNPMIEEFFRRT